MTGPVSPAAFALLAARVKGLESQLLTQQAPRLLVPRALGDEARRELRQAEAKLTELEGTISAAREALKALGPSVSDPNQRLVQQILDRSGGLGPQEQATLRAAEGHVAVMERSGEQVLMLLKQMRELGRSRALNAPLTADGRYLIF